MLTVYSVQLKADDLLQIIDALNTRASSYEETARYLRGGFSEDEFIIAEDCTDADEAEEISNHFREIVRTIEDQTNVRY